MEGGVMQGALTIVAYHYVRDLRHSRYPDIKGMSTSDFDEQLKYITKHYNVVSGPEVMDAFGGGTRLPPRPLLLTFDDGYADHFSQVFPILDRARVPGCFFPPASVILEHKVLDVNKIHFILASVPDSQKLVDYIIQRVDEHRLRHDLLTTAEYWTKLALPSRYDSAGVMFCKRMLQRELPIALREAITGELFRRYVTADEESFSRELYMTSEQLGVLHRHGMYIGSHGYDHVWLNTLGTQQQEQEVDRSLAFLEAVGTNTSRWMMCYPYGGYDDSLVAVLESRKCVIGLTTEVGLCRHGEHHPLKLPRLNANDLPRDPDAAVVEWTVAAGR